MDDQGHVVVVGNEDRAWRVVRLDSEGRLLPDDADARSSRVPSAMAYGVRLLGGGEAVIAGNQRLKRTHVRVERLDARGRQLWEYLDHSGIGASGRAVDVDAAGNAIVVGEFSTDWLMLGLDPSGRLLWRFTHDGGGGRKNPDRALAVAVHPSGDFIVAGFTHPVPPKPPSLGFVEWRIARYRVVGRAGGDEG